MINTKKITILGILFLTGLIASYFLNNSYLVSFTVFIALWVTGYLALSLEQVKQVIPDKINRPATWNFFQPSFFVLLHFILFHSFEKIDLMYSLIIIELGAIQWFFCYSPIINARFSSTFMLYLFYSIFLVSIFHCLFFMIADLHFKIQVSFDLFNIILFIFFSFSTLMKTALNYQLLTNKSSQSIHYVKLFLLISPGVLILGNYLFYPIGFEADDFVTTMIDCAILYFFPILSFIYFTYSSYIKKTYFYNPYYEDQVRMHLNMIQTSLAQGKALHQVYYTFFPRADQENYSFEQFEKYYHSLSVIKKD